MLNQQHEERERKRSTGRIMTGRIATRWKTKISNFFILKM